jgi:hypothetical protein
MAGKVNRAGKASLSIATDFLRECCRTAILTSKWKLDNHFDYFG